MIRKGHEYPARAIVAAAFEKAEGRSLRTKDFPPYFSEGDYANLFSRLGLIVKERSGN